MDDVADWIKRTRNPMEIRFIKHFHDDPGYIASVAATVANTGPRTAAPTSC
jgi:ferrochelatase